LERLSGETVGFSASRDDDGQPVQIGEKSQGGALACYYLPGVEADLRANETKV
jgi:hypothetical protein